MSDFKVTDEFLNVLAFSILMGNRQVLGKSPDYITEKFTRYCGMVQDVREDESWRSGLDGANTNTFKEYLKRWNLTG